MRVNDSYFQFCYGFDNYTVELNEGRPLYLVATAAREDDLNEGDDERCTHVPYPSAPPPENRGRGVSAVSYWQQGERIPCGIVWLVCSEFMVVTAFL